MFCATKPFQKAHNLLLKYFYRKEERKQQLFFNKTCVIRSQIQQYSGLHASAKATFQSKRKD